mgnify:CR=1 FL=1|tara:strand:- start:3179 stop:3349 length:171 start_codon:yes stop_codon:yes gene_type:complete
MNIQKIDIIGEETIIITSSNNHIKKFNKNDITGPERVWFENIISCSISLMKDPFIK